ncbi:pre-mRNA-splicing factor 18 [Chloropicon primus]|uniref:Pre-mRNA-splicing factor 18 n=2 Tax=Chloropicon primus TaxID=1764295 RepID=A0A5B8MTU3_9CHLO|nr:pre-mRNA-splicing factor 18 [Chloropicon primus]UPR03134.1 pre-mRNA-splicing factor 18 [Chloropicon primus]|eukprot:QDZ23923.1 pre-mRNA-splicing factor 18 [Chloropicon primus]
MEALRAELARKRKERGKGATTSGEVVAVEAGKPAKKYRSRGEVERERIERERREREQRGVKGEKGVKGEGGGGSGGAADPTKARGDEDRGGKSSSLSNAEVKRRLRLLKQPAMLFGEVDSDRYERLKRVERELVVEDTYAVGQQANTVLEIQREEEEARQRMLRKEAARREKDDEERTRTGNQVVAYSDKGPESEAERTLAAFKAAAEKVKAEQRENAMEVGEAVVSYIKRMMAEWEEEVNNLPEEVKRTGEGKQGFLQFRATQRSFELLYERIGEGTLVEAIKAALGRMVKAMKERNYLHASEIYVMLSIGNAPWPIGVTSVGIHDRSAREKISFAMNGEAHVMNDEGTRKFIHGFKRLMTWVQKNYPTDPSRSLDFNRNA